MQKRNGTTYLKMTGKEKLTTLGIRGVIMVLCIIAILLFDFFKSYKLTSKRLQG